MFYDKVISIMKYNEGYKDEYLTWHNGGLVIDKTTDCDVQPITQEIAFRDFGTTEKVKHRIFSDVIDGIVIGTIIKYENKNYRVINILDWDDYLDFIIGDYNV